MSEDETLQTGPRRARSGFCLGCVVGGLLLVVAVVGLAIAVRRQPEDFPPAVRAIFGAKQPRETGEATGGLSPELLEAARGVKPTVEVTLKEEDLNAYLQEHPEAIGLPSGFEAPQVGFREGQVMASARTKVVVPVRVTVAMKPEVKEGRISLTVTKVDAGGISLPGEFRKQIQKEMEGLIAEQVEEAGFEPTSVEVGKGRLTIRGQLAARNDG